MTVRIAIGQAAFGTDVAANVATVVRLRAAASAAGADLLVLSELFLPGYRMAGMSDERVVALDDPRLAPLTDGSSRTELLVGAAVSTPAGLVNGILRFAASGGVELAYAKLHLWEDERASFVAGQDLAIVEVAGLRVGLGVCYDAGFPEFSRAYARAGVDLIAFSSAFFTGEQGDRYDIYHPARALESGCYVAVSDAAGADGATTFYGHSRVFDPTGRLLADLGPGTGAIADAGEIAVVDVSPETVAATRASLPYLDHLYPTYHADR